MYMIPVQTYGYYCLLREDSLRKLRRIRNAPSWLFIGNLKDEQRLLANLRKLRAEVLPKA